MPDTQIVRDLTLVMATALVAVYVLGRLRVPSVVAFLLAGAIVGPWGLSLVRDLHSIELLAEIGIALLLFTIGLKFSLKHLLTMRRLVFGAGVLQVLLTMAAGGYIFMALDIPPAKAMFLAALLALSSTAVVLKLLEERGEVNAPHGRLAVGILLLQDLAIVPLMLAIPLMANNNPGGLPAILKAAGVAIGMVLAVVYGARWIFPWILEHIVKLRSREAFTLTTMLLALGTAYAVTHAGLSLALGAFLAGMILADSDYAHQILAEITPFRDAFASLFFVSVGMLVDLSTWGTMAMIVGVGAVSVVALKLVLCTVVGLVSGLGPRVAVMAGLALAQVGEFSFILAQEGFTAGLIGEERYQQFLSISVLSMLATPFLINAAPMIGNWVAAWPLLARWHPHTMEKPDGESAVAALRDHVVVVGYGLNGRNVVRVLRQLEVPYVVIELNPHLARDAREEGCQVLYGDASQSTVLDHAGTAHARILVVAISDPPSTRQIVGSARHSHAELQIVARTRQIAEVEALYRLGATEVIPEEFETSLELAATVMEAYGASPATIEREQAAIRSEHYGLFREDRPHGRHRPLAALLAESTVLEVEITRESLAVGSSLRELDLRGQTGASVIGLLRGEDIRSNPNPDDPLLVGDVVHIFGTAVELEAAQALFLGTGASL